MRNPLRPLYYAGRVGGSVKMHSERLKLLVTPTFFNPKRQSKTCRIHAAPSKCRKVLECPSSVAPIIQGSTTEFELRRVDGCALPLSVLVLLCPALSIAPGRSQAVDCN